MEDVLAKQTERNLSELLRVLLAATIELVGLSEKTWERLEAAGDIPVKLSCRRGASGIASTTSSNGSTPARLERRDGQRHRDDHQRR